MGLLSTFFVASEPEARAFTGQTEWPPEDALNSGGLHVFHLATLRGIFLGVPPLEGMNDLFPLISDPANEATWTFGIADDLAAALIAAGETDFTRVTSEWIASEDMAGCPLDVGVRLLGDLRRLALRARDTGRSMYLWVSL